MNPMSKKKISGMGMLQKLLLGIFIPILVAFLIIWILIFHTWDFRGIQIKGIKDIGAETFKQLIAFSLNESKSSLDRLGEKIIKEKALDVATQIEIFIKGHSKTKGEDLLKDPTLHSIALQKVGETGYTFVYDNKGINYFHPNHQIVGMDLHQLAEKFPGFWKILEASLKGPASGYYDWKDADGKIRTKYTYLTPVKDTNFIVAATIDADEFSRPARAIEATMKQIERRYLDEYESRMKIFYLVSFLIIVILLVRIYFYSRAIIQPIRYLSELADKISMGDLDTPVDIKAKGEVGVLVESIERMQTSVKAAIERLQKRKESKEKTS